MAVEATSNSIPTVGTKSQVARQQLTEDLDDFLNLLIVQLKNQDPTEPMDSNQFTEQIVQMSSVEQAINTNDNLETLIAMQNNTTNTELVALTGKLVEATGSRIQLSETGAKFAYELEAEADNVFVQVYDDNGDVIFAGEGTTIAGRNTVTWDGQDLDGNPADLGYYNIRVSAKFPDSSKLETLTTYVGGRVEGVNMTGVEPTLIVNGEEVTLDDINFIGEPAS